MKKLSLTLVTILFFLWIFGHFIAAAKMTQMNQSFIHDVEKRNPLVFPTLKKATDLLSMHFYKQISDALNERMVFRGALIVLKNNLDYRLFGKRQFQSVDIGKEDWYFIREAYYLKDETTERRQRIMEKIDGLMQAFSTNHANVMVFVTPDKHTLYPEKLNTVCHRNIKKGNNRGKVIKDYFEKHSSKKIVPLWQDYFKAKDKQQDLLFYERDTHHTPYGALVMAKAIVEKYYPGLWQDSEVVDSGIVPWCGDLMLMSGLGRKTEDRHEIDIKRSGVELVEKSVMERSVNAMKRVHYVSKSKIRPMIKGKTIVLHDSMMAYSYETIRQYFEDITLMHYDNANSAGRFEEILGSYDRVIIETAERVAFRTLTKLADGYLYKTIHEMNKQDLDNIICNDEVRIEQTKEGTQVSVLGNNPIIYLPPHYYDVRTDYIVSIELDSDKATSSQLYYQTNEEQFYSEERSQTRSFSAGYNNLHFQLPAESMFYPLRFDPTNCSGTLLIKSMHLRKAKSIQDETEESFYLKTQQAPLEVMEIDKQKQMQSVQVKQTMLGDYKTAMIPVSAGMLLYATKPDAYLILPAIGSYSSDSKPVLEVGLSLPEGNMAQLFYLTGENETYNEKNSIRKSTRTGENYLSMSLPMEALAYPIRLDPVTNAGKSLIRYIRIIGLKKSDGHGITKYYVYPRSSIKKIRSQM